LAVESLVVPLKANAAKLILCGQILHAPDIQGFQARNLATQKTYMWLRDNFGGFEVPENFIV
jgi:hypothetical protein